MYGMWIFESVAGLLLVYRSERMLFREELTTTSDPFSSTYHGNLLEHHAPQVHVLAFSRPNCVVH